MSFYCARPMKTGSSSLSRLSSLSGCSDRKFIQKNQTDQPTRQTNPGAFREHRGHSVQAHVYPIHPHRGVAKAALYCAHRTKAGSSGLSRLSGLSDRKFIKKNQTDQKDQPTRQTNPGALREHRRSTGSIPSSAPGAKNRHGHRSNLNSCGRGRRSSFGGGLFRD